MADILYNNVNVDSRYSPILEPNLYYDSVFQPGITFNASYQAGSPQAGMVRVYRQGAAGVIKPGATAQKFTHEDIQNELIDIRLNNAFRVSRVIYQVQANSIAYALADQVLSEAVQSVRQGWMVSGLSCLVNEGTTLADTDAVTKDNIKAQVLAARKAARKGMAVPRVVLASVDTYSTMLEIAGGDYTPSLNDSMISAGQVGTWLGMTWYECNATEETDAKYYNYAGTVKTKKLSDVAFVMYDPAAFTIINNLELMRIVDSENFAGSLAQVEFNTGYRVTNAAKVIVKTVAAV